jgi:hypothetical protein
MPNRSEQVWFKADIMLVYKHVLHINVTKMLHQHDNTNKKGRSSSVLSKGLSDMFAPTVGSTAYFRNSVP